VVHATPSYTDAFLFKDTRVSSTQLNRPIWNKNVSFSPLTVVIGRQYSLQKLPQFSQGNNVLDATASNIDVFLFRDI
jgi:hypothetical protein